MFKFNNKFIYLLIAFGLFLIVPPFIANPDTGRFFFNLFLSLTLIIGGLSMIYNKKMFAVYILIAAMPLALNWISYFYRHYIILTELKLTGLFIFYVFLFYRIIDEVFKSKDITNKLIFGAVNGYVIIGIIGGTLCMLTDMIYKNAFLFHENQNKVFYNYLYYSFTVLSASGYGDIVPALPQSKALSVFISIFSQIYIAIIIAIIVGKYLKEKDAK